MRLPPPACPCYVPHTFPPLLVLTKFIFSLVVVKEETYNATQHSENDLFLIYKFSLGSLIGAKKRLA